MPFFGHHHVLLVDVAHDVPMLVDRLEGDGAIPCRVEQEAPVGLGEILLALGDAVEVVDLEVVDDPGHQDAVDNRGVAVAQRSGRPGRDLEQVGAAQLGHGPELVAATPCSAACCRAWRPSRACPRRRRPRPRRRPRRAWRGAGPRSPDGHAVGSGRLGGTSVAFRVARRSVLSSSVRSLTRFESMNSSSEARSVSSSGPFCQRAEQWREEPVVDLRLAEIEGEHLEAIGENGQLGYVARRRSRSAGSRGNRPRSGTGWCSRTRRCRARMRARSPSGPSKTITPSPI